MIRFCFILLMVLGLQSCGEKDKVRLVVVLVVDQMRADYIQKFKPDFGEGGFNRLLSEGTHFQNHHITYANTETGPGHAVILSGLLPKNSGIVKNFWYKQGTEKKVYCVKGGPDQFKGKTIGDYLVSQYKGAKVYSISTKDRSAILLGGKNPTGVFWADKKSNYITSSPYYKQLPAWVSEWNKNNFMKKDTSVLWESLEDSQNFFSDSLSPFPRDKKWVGHFPYKMSLSMYRHSYMQTRRHFNFIRRLIEKEHLGQDDIPDVLAWSISSTDYMGHLFGMESQELRETFIHVDRLLEDFMTYLDVKVGENNYSVFLTSDHGVRPTVEWEKARGNKKAFRIDKSQMTRSIVDSLRNDFFIPKYADVNMDYRLFRIRGNNVYVNKNLSDSLNIAYEPFRKKLKGYIEKIPGVIQVVDLREPLGSDPFSKAVEANYYPGRMGEFMIQLDSNVNFLGPLGKHGYFHPDCTHIPLLIRIPGQPSGVVSRKTRLVDLAPTIAQHLGLRLEGGVDGVVIDEVVQN